MIVEEKVESGNYLTPAFLADRKISWVTITGDVTEVELTYDGVTKKKYQVPVTYDRQQPEDPSKWTMNPISSNALLRKFGNDSGKWIGQKIPLQIDGSGTYRHIKVNQIALQ